MVKVFISATLVGIVGFIGGFCVGNLILWIYKCISAGQIILKPEFHPGIFLAMLITVMATVGGVVSICVWIFKMQLSYLNRTKNADSGGFIKESFQAWQNKTCKKIEFE